jgi:hypothetical protein
MLRRLCERERLRTNIEVLGSCLNDIGRASRKRKKKKKVRLGLVVVVVV